MSRRDFGASIVRDRLTELDASVRIIWFIQRIECADEVALSDVVNFFTEHALSSPNKSRLQSRLLTDRRILKGSKPGHVRLRAAELSRLDAERARFYKTEEVTSKFVPAGIEYHGIPGASHDCQLAVMRLLQGNVDISTVRILTCKGNHCLLVRTGVGDRIAIKSGFTSGYGGEGPTRFSMTLEALRCHSVEIDECEVPDELIQRIDSSCLTEADLQVIDLAPPIHPRQWTEYVCEVLKESERVWSEFPPVVPISLVDSRIRDLALRFFERPDEALLKAYRRIEDAVRARTGIKEHGTKLFSKAFAPPSGPLTWHDIDEGERSGRYQLFTASFMAHRNPRAHREINSNVDDQLSEFLLLNHLFRLEREARLCPEHERIIQR